MPFKKGHATNLGRKASDETRAKLRAIHKGKRPSDWGGGFARGNEPWNGRASVARNAYFAGLVDGEGSIFTTNNGAKRPGEGNYKKLCVVITMRRDKAQPLPEGQAIWGGSIHDRKPRKSMQNWALDWRMSGNIAERFLRCIFPYMRIKNKQAELGLEYLHRLHSRKGYTITQEELDWRKVIEDQIKALNH